MSNALSIAEFAAKAKKLNEANRPRLIFGLDATASRSPTWLAAQRLQAEMFAEAAKLGTLEMKIAFFHGSDALYSHWSTKGEELASLMQSVTCISGNTQIERLFRHALDESAVRHVDVFVYIGDTMEEHLPTLQAAAKAMGDLGIKLFMFQEGHSSTTREQYQEIVKANGHGAYFQFDDGAIKAMSDLLKAIAEYATGGIEALKRSSLPGAKLLLTQIKE